MKRKRKRDPKVDHAEVIDQDAFYISLGLLTRFFLGGTVYINADAVDALSSLGEKIFTEDNHAFGQTLLRRGLVTLGHTKSGVPIAEVHSWGGISDLLEGYLASTAVLLSPGGDA